MNDIVIPRRILRLINEILEGSLRREQVLPHMLFVGPPGVGKTTLASYIAERMGVSMIKVIGGAISKPKDIIPILVKLSRGTILFIDEIHRLSPSTEEVLYPALDRYEIDILVGKGNVKHIYLEPFTLIGATTLEDKISSPLRSRFSIVVHVGDYEREDLEKMVDMYADSLPLTDDAKDLIIRVSRRNPRRLVLIIERLKDFYMASRRGYVKEDDVRELLRIIDYEPQMGLDRRERKYLHTLAHTFGGGPVGVKSLAAAIGESVNAVQEIIEPPLLAEGLITITSRGRKLTPKGWDVLS